jgi:hypothetical protein
MKQLRFRFACFESIAIIFDRDHLHYAVLAGIDLPLIISDCHVEPLQQRTYLVILGHS